MHIITFILFFSHQLETNLTKNILHLTFIEFTSISDRPTILFLIECWKILIEQNSSSREGVTRYPPSRRYQPDKSHFNPIVIRLNRTTIDGGYRYRKREEEKGKKKNNNNTSYGKNEASRINIIIPTTKVRNAVGIEKYKLFFSFFFFLLLPSSLTHR